MAYATQDDLLQSMTMQELIQITDDNRPPTEVNATVVTGALADASAFVDSYCRSRYVTPLQASQDVTRITRDVAIYYLYKRRPQKMTDNVRLLFSDAQSLLKDVSVGKASLDQPVGSISPQVSGAGPVLPRCRDERFNEHNLKGFI
jgi:phage gp36-like protein